MESSEKTRVIGRKCVIKVSSLHSQTETGKVHWSEYYRGFWVIFYYLLLVRSAWLLGFYCI